jgi:KDO2-lipid IV(A) lauroyltransferase
VKAALTQALAPDAPAALPAANESASRWLERLFFVAERAPDVLRIFRVPLARLAYQLSSEIRSGTSANAFRILGSESTPVQRERLRKAVVENFILFCRDVGQSMRMNVEQLYARIEKIEGDENYARARALRRGAIVVTAHMGSFETGMAALRRQNERVHVVFQRDAFRRFEKMRAALRAKLGIIEAPVDDGWTIWMRLRDALARDEVVVLQGDRVMPGQKGQRARVLDGDMMLPSGPAKLSLATGAPIVPVFALRTTTGNVRLCVEPAIIPGTVESAMAQLAAVIGEYIRAYPEQWLMLQPAWCDDAKSN